jgi:hypothetical protein
MKVALAAQYRAWMLALFPATLGVGTAALWFRSRNWPLAIDETGVRLRSHRYLNWASIIKLGVSRNYLDGSVSHIRMHHADGIIKVPVSGLEDGQAVLATMIFMFKRTSGAKEHDESTAGISLSAKPAERNMPFDGPSRPNRNVASDLESLSGMSRAVPVVSQEVTEQPNKLAQT